MGVASRVTGRQFQVIKGRTTIGAGVNNYPDLRRELNQKAATSEQGYLLAWDPGSLRKKRSVCRIGCRGTDAHPRHRR